MEVKIDASWEEQLQEEFNKKYFIDLTAFVRDAYKNSICFPPASEIFSAFNHTLFHQIKVVIIGQDPYHGAGQANGLCFSVRDEIAHPPSLKNIFKELNEQLDIPIPTSGNLERWAAQGVLLLNATLTVEAGKAGSHQKKGWEQFTDTVIDSISKEREGVVFLLWGGFAKKKGRKVDTTKHLVLTTGHPSPLSANRGYWFGNEHFKKVNEYLLKKGKAPIKW